MATVLKKDTAHKGKVTAVSETAKSFVLTFEGADKVFFVAKRTAFASGYVTRSSFMNKEFSIIPQQEATSGNGWLGSIELTASAKFQDKLEQAAANHYTASIYASAAASDLS